MIFPEVLGHEHARDVLGRMLRSDRVPHALLFHGPEGVGKRLVGERFVTSLLCDVPGALGSACGRWDSSSSSGGKRQRPGSRANARWRGRIESEKVRK